MDSLTWDEIGLVAEGLAYGQRPLRAATRDVRLEYDLGPRGPWILSLISAGTYYPLELSLALAIGRSLITAEVARLIRAGLVTSKSDSIDRRRTQLALTPLGLAACERVRTQMKRMLKRNLSAYSTTEVRLMIRMMRDVRRLEGEETDEGF